MNYSRAGLLGRLAESDSGVQGVERCTCSDIFIGPQRTK